MKRGLFLIILWYLTLFGISQTRQLKNIRYYSYPDYTRVVIDLSANVQIREKLLPGKTETRLYFDLTETRFSGEFPVEKRREIVVDAGNLKRIRIGNQDRSTIRVVFDFSRIGRYNTFSLTTPFRIVFDIHRLDAMPEKPDTVPDSKEIEKGKKLSLARQLGLGVNRIVIDPGHGGKDPGTINRSLNLFEKDLTLDIARRLKRILGEHPAMEVRLTREDDRYLSLEERTAIANSLKADLFVSIHVNAAPNETSQGIETYYLSLSTDPWAMSVAAKENAIGSKTLAEMESIIEKIVTNSRVSESRDFTQSLQSVLIEHLNSEYQPVIDLGTKKAPFYVLLGADMPAALVELSFLSHPVEGHRLKNDTYRRALSVGLYFGIISYIKKLKGNETF